jgi:hypothetical protein
VNVYEKATIKIQAEKYIGNCLYLAHRNINDLSGVFKNQTTVS